MVDSADSAPFLAATTTDLPPREQFEYFCDALCDVYLGIRPLRATAMGFDADVLAYGWDDTVLSRIRAPGHDARRDRAALSAEPDDALFLNFSYTASTVTVAGGVTAVRAASPLLLDNAEPFHLRFDPSRRFRLYSLRLPRETEGRRWDAAAVAKANERMRSTRLGGQLALQTRLMAAEFDAGRTVVAGAMAKVVPALLYALCSPDDGTAVDPPGGRFDLYTATATTRLGQPGFGVQQLAAIHHVSVRTVQNAFAAHGQTFTEWMVRERLELARDRLSDPAWRHLSVERIARACGFVDPSGFHRAFRARFGSTPGAYRPDPSRGGSRRRTPPTA